MVSVVSQVQLLKNLAPKGSLIADAEVERNVGTGQFHYVFFLQILGVPPSHHQLQATKNHILALQEHCEVYVSQEIAWIDDLIHNGTNVWRLQTTPNVELRIGGLNLEEGQKVLCIEIDAPTTSKPQLNTKRIVNTCRKKR